MRSARPLLAEGTRFVAPLVLLWLLPVLALIAVIPAVIDREVNSVTMESPTTATVGSRENDFRQSVTAIFTLAEPEDILLPVGGLVTAVHAVPGRVLEPTDPIVSVDGATLRAHVDTQPFYRDIGPETSGTDVEQLRSYLEGSGVLEPQEGATATGEQMTQGVKAYQKANGFPEDGVFRPSYVVYVPAEARAVGAVLVKVGTLVSVGEVVLEGPAHPVSLSFTADSPLRLALKAGPFAVLILDEEVPLTSLTPSTEDVVRLHAALVGATKRGGPPVMLEGDTESFSGVMLHLSIAETRGTVPSAAIHTTASGAQCLFLTLDEDHGTTRHDPGDPVATPVSDAAPADGEIGLTFVQADLIGRSIHRNPTSLPDSVLETCA